MNTIKPSSPLPWSDNHNPTFPHLIDGDGFELIVNGRAANQQDRAYIVHACNNYPSLVDALQKIVDIRGSTGGPESLVSAFQHIAATALAIATN